MTPDDKALRETLDLLSQVVASISGRLDKQGEALDRLAEAQERMEAAASPDRVAAATAQAVRQVSGDRGSVAQLGLRPRLP